MPIPTKAVHTPRRSLREQAEEQIRAAIFDGTLEPGEVLSDAHLQEWLGVSRQPIREALNDLARFGLVEMVPQKYTRVAVPNPADRTAILQTLGALLGGVVRVTVPSLTDAQRVTLIDHLDRVAPLVEAKDVHEHGRLAWELADHVVDLCPNHILVRATRDMIDSLAFQLAATRTDDSSDWPRLSTGYATVREAVLSEDAIAAELAVEEIFRLSVPLTSGS